MPRRSRRVRILVAASLVIGPLVVVASIFPFLNGYRALFQRDLLPVAGPFPGPLPASVAAPGRRDLPNIVGSLTGKDIFVETDCASGGCNAAGSDPHLMIYKADCPNSPWFDVVRGVCRD